MIEKLTVIELGKRHKTHPRTVRGKCEHYGIPIVDGLVDAGEYALAVEAGDKRTKGKAPEGKGAVATRLDAQTQKLIIECGLKSLDLRKREGELVERKAADKTFADLAIQVRSDWLSLSSRVSSECAMKSAGSVKEILDKESHRVLRRLASMKPEYGNA